jgi:colicin import membrane protein
MNRHAYPGASERAISGAGAFGMHLLFIALLFFGVNWQKKVEPPSNIVDLWNNLPSQAEPKVEAKPPPPPPPPAPPTPKVEPAPPKPVPKAESAKPDIAMKEKVEKERRLLEEKQKAAKKAEEEAKAAQKVKEAEAQRAKEQEEMQRKLAEQAVAARAAALDKYKKAISDKIRRFIVLPPNMQGNPESEFEVIQLPGGEVLDVRLKRASGNSAYDNAVERAIRRAQPLPLPPEPSLFQRELSIPFRAYDK